MMIIPRDILKDWTVLVVDDEPDSLEVASIILQSYGAKIVTAINGKQALEVLQTVHPKFIISDLSMPVLDGWKMMEQIKSIPAIADIPVIALTAHAMLGDRERGLAVGFYNYLTKPLTPSTFIRDLLRLLIDVPVLAPELTRVTLD